MKLTKVKANIYSDCQWVNPDPDYWVYGMLDGYYLGIENPDGHMLSVVVLGPPNKQKAVRKLLDAFFRHLDVLAETDDIEYPETPKGMFKTLERWLQNK